MKRVTNALIYHVASGQSFFSGVALILTAVATSYRPGRRVVASVRTIAAILGMILVAVSATPLPLTFYLPAGAISLVWLVTEGSSRAPRRRRQILRGAVVVVWFIGVACEAPYHRMPAIPPLGRPAVDVVGDSLGAGLGEAEPWPDRLARRHSIVVRNRSIAGAGVAKALASEAGRVSDPDALVLIEIGGNDVLGGTTPNAFERDLDALLAVLRSGGRTVVMLELPLPPFANGYGAAQRRAARSHGVLLVPKRLLLGVLAADESTLDSVHLSTAGHDLMADAIWGVIHPAFGPPSAPSSRTAPPDG